MMATDVQLHKVRAGWYETATEPADGVLVVRSEYSGYYKKTWWEILRYTTSTVDGGLDLVSTGDIYNTLRDAKMDNLGRPIDDGITGTCSSCEQESHRLAYDCSPYNRLICPDCSY